ncbi:hypothetical protein PYR71_22255, partial [Rhizobium sp. MC63]
MQAGVLSETGSDLRADAPAASTPFVQIQKARLESRAFLIDRSQIRLERTLQAEVARRRVVAVVRIEVLNR